VTRVTRMISLRCRAMFRKAAVGGQIMGEKAEHGRSCQSVLLVLAVLLNATLAGAGVTVAVTTCGQMVEGRGVLAADLGCSTSQGSAIGVRKSQATALIDRRR